MERYSFTVSAGTFTAESENGYLTALFMGASEWNETKCEILLETEKQIREYLSGKRNHFDLKIHLKGTDFQKDVWKAVVKIGYGETVSYEDIAITVGRPKALRAVGTAVGKNPLPLIVPCHRVIRKSGQIGNYALGVSLKTNLLEMEEKYCKKAV